MDGYAIITAGFSVLEGLIWAISVSVLLKPRFFSVCTTTIILFLYTAIRNLTGDFFHYESYLTLIFYIINFIGIFVLYTGSLKDVFFLFALLNVGMIFMEGISFSAFGPMRFSAMVSSESQLMIPKITGMFIYPFIQIGHAFLLKQIVSKWSSNIVNKFYIFLISQPVLAFIAILTQQRAPLFIIAAITLIYIAIGFFKKKRDGHTSLKLSIIYFLIASICMFGVFVSFIDIDMLARLLEKIEVLSDASVFLDERANIFSQFLAKDVTLFGDGIGRYSAAAYRMGKNAITDQQYLLTAYETGYWGCLGYGFIILVVIIKGLKSFSVNYFEIIIILFYLLAMSGANCLSSFGQHIAIFWICCGRIYNGSILHDKRKNLAVVYDRI